MAAHGVYIFKVKFDNAMPCRQAKHYHEAVGAGLYLAAHPRPIMPPGGFAIIQQNIKTIIAHSCGMAATGAVIHLT